MNIIGIEFDRSKFETAAACEDWLRVQIPYSYLLDFKYFKLKSTTCQFLCEETNRKVWSWQCTWRAKEIRTERPQPYIVIIRDVGSERWFYGDVPIPLESTQEKRRKVDLLRQQRDIKRRETLAKVKTKLKAPKKEKEAKPKKEKEAKPKKERKSVKEQKEKKPKKVKIESSLVDSIPDEELLKVDDRPISPLGESSDEPVSLDTTITSIIPDMTISMN